MGQDNDSRCCRTRRASARISEAGKGHRGVPFAHNSLPEQLLTDKACGNEALRAELLAMEAHIRGQYQCHRRASHLRLLP